MKGWIVVFWFIGRGREGKGGENESVATGIIDRLLSRPGGGSFPALLGGVEMDRGQTFGGLRTFASSDGGEYAMLTIDWLFAS